MSDTTALANVLYLLIVAGIWLAAMALVTPGTGLLELLALGAFAGGAAGILLLPTNAWAAVGFAVGAVLFGAALVGRRPGAGIGATAGLLLASAIALGAGSILLFRTGPGGPPAVHPLLATVASVGTLAYFWFVIRKAAAAQVARPVIDPRAVKGQVGEARTDLAPTGTVYVAGELWTARSPTPIRAGSKVRVVQLAGLILEVAPIGESGAAGQAKEAMRD